MKKRIQWLLILTMVLGPVRLCPCCGLVSPEIAVEGPPVVKEPVAVEEPEEPMEEPAETLVYESPSVQLDLYLEEPDGSLSFWVFVVNPNLGPLSDSQAQVVLYDDSGTSLTESTETCGRIEAFSECWVTLDFDKALVTEEYTAYNIYAEVTTPHGETLTAQLSDEPVSGEEGVAISKGRRLPDGTVHVTWDLPSDGYSPGEEVEAQMELLLFQGQLEEGLACLQITELRQYADGQREYVILAERCEKVSLSADRVEPHLIRLGFEPSGFTWISQESPDGTYTPLEIGAHAALTYRDIVLGEDESELHLPPIEVIAAWWERAGYPTDVYQPGESCTANITVRSLVDDPLPHTVQLSVRYTEQDPEEWLLSGLLLFIPCLLGLCKDEAVVLTQTYDILLAADEEIVYSSQVQPPLHPTGEIGVGGYFYLALAFDGVTIWRGSRISPASEP